MDAASIAFWTQSKLTMICIAPLRCAQGSKCTQGYYCPPGSISSRQHKCGNVGVYCPTGSGLPTVAPPGYYTVNGETVIGQISAIVSGEATRSHVLICPKGHYCFGGVKIPCPKGKYGATEGLSVSNCSGDVDPELLERGGRDKRAEQKVFSWSV